VSKLQKKQTVFFFVLLVISDFYLYFSRDDITMMTHDISQPVPQGSYRAQDAENSRIAAIADELERICAVHEAQFRDSQQDVSRFETEQRAAEQIANSQGVWMDGCLQSWRTWSQRQRE